MLYPSDCGYSASSSYWNTELSNYSSGAMDTSWMYINASGRGLWEWFLSLASNSNYFVMSWYTYDGSTNYTYDYENYDIVARPTLNHLSAAPIDANHQGTESDPYVVIGS